MLRKSISEEIKRRRDRLIQKHPGSVFIFPSPPEQKGISGQFRQDSSFYYLSGFDEPEAFLVIGPSSSKGVHRSALFVRARDEKMELWNGERYGVDGALKVFGVDEAYLNTEFDKIIPQFLKNAEKIQYRVGVDEPTDRKILGILENYRLSQGRTGKALFTIVDPGEAVGEMRLFKSQEEIETMRKVCEITAQAHKTLMKEVRPGMNEYELAALAEYEFRRHGCQRLGYGSIVGGGKNATCLHYHDNNEPLKDGDLVLVDAGGELDYFSADITRTFPVNGKFSAAQAKIYDIVLKSQEETIAQCKPGATFEGLHEFATLRLIEGLITLGLLSGKPEEIYKAGGHSRFYPHRTGHWLGLDVHDTGLYYLNGKSRVLEPGMVFTVEPGLYFQPSDREAPAEFRNIGIRIEDDILITEKGCEVFTRSAPKRRADIEGLRK